MGLPSVYCGIIKDRFNLFYNFQEENYVLIVKFSPSEYFPENKLDVSLIIVNIKNQRN